MNRRKKRMKETAAIAVLYLILVIALLMLIFVGAEAKETEPTITRDALDGDYTGLKLRSNFEATSKC